MRKIGLRKVNPLKQEERKKGTTTVNSDQDVSLPYGTYRLMKVQYKRVEESSLCRTNK